MNYIGTLYGKVGKRYIPVIHPDFLVIGAFRYALGRQTYVVNETVEWLMANWANISRNAQFVIKRDLAEAIHEDDSDLLNGDKYRRLGADIDRREWVRLGTFFFSVPSVE